MQSNSFKYIVLASMMLLLVFTQCAHRSRHRLPNATLKLFGNDSVTAQISNYESKQRHWVDSVFNTLTLDEKLAQLFMVAAYSRENAKHWNDLTLLVRDFKIGGVMCMQGGPKRQVAMLNMLQSQAKVPLLVSQDLEWGLAMRLDSVQQFPRQMTLGAAADERLVYAMGKAIAQQCKAVGVHVSFSPCADVNSNPLNPVIGSRSFGENVGLVSKLSVAYMRGLQDHGIIANAKHFPGHGDASADSHYSLPIINRTMEQLDQVELAPFKQLFEEGIMSVMVAHLQVPALDTAKFHSTSLSKSTITDLLRTRMGYNGLIFTDALNMKAVANYYRPGELEQRALAAGNDVLLFAENVPSALYHIKQAIADGKLDTNQIFISTKKVLAAKYFAGLYKYQPLDPNKLAQALMDPETDALIKKLFAKAATVVRDEKQLLPLKANLSDTIVSITLNAEGANVFQRTLWPYGNWQMYQWHKAQPQARLDSIGRSVKPGRKVIVSVHNITSRAEQNYNVPSGVHKLLARLDSMDCPTALVTFGNCYSANALPLAKTWLCMYETRAETEQQAAEILLGIAPAGGKLPVAPNANYVQGMGINLVGNRDMISTAMPVELSISPSALAKIDTLVSKAIKDKVMPGCQVLAMKGGKVFYNKGFGKLDYGNSPNVNTQTVYDLASISKVAGTLQIIAQLVDKGQLAIDDTLGKYLPETRGHDKGKITIRKLLTHTAGLQAFSFFWKRTMTDTAARRYYWSDTASQTHSIPVAAKKFLRNDAQDSMKKWVLESPMATPQGGLHPYKYSDFSFYYLKQVVEIVARQKLDQMVYERWKQPLGLPTLTYNPRLFNYPYSIAPTEMDTAFRKQTLQGYVHDPFAAMEGGVGGHAGLFGTAIDLAIIGQTWLNLGTYNGTRLLTANTVKTFTQKQENGYRGLGWDKPNPDPKANAASKYASSQTFGHTGFTGTCLWIDPANDLVYVFLSNRVHPDASNNKLVSLNIRPRIHDLIYESLPKRNVSSND